MIYLFKTTKKKLPVLAMILLFTACLWSQFPEGFESGTIPDTWTVHNLSDGFCRFYAANIGSVAYEGSWVAESIGNVVGSDEWLVTPALSPTSENRFVRFWAQSSDGSHPESFFIKLSSYGPAVSGFTVEVAHHVNIPTTWTEYIVDLNDYIG